MTHPYPRAGVSVAVFRQDEVLLIQRGKAPFDGLWSLPGGAVQFGETAKMAAMRELDEETGLTATELVVGDVVDAIVRDGDGAIVAHYTISVFATSRFSGALLASGDAKDARWFGQEAVLKLRCTPGLETAIANSRLALKWAER